MSTKTIELTQALIRKGCRGGSENCPIARALRIAFPAYLFAVGKGVAYVYNQDRKLLGKVYLPDSARDFVLDFDGGFPVKPFSFELPLPLQFI